METFGNLWWVWLIGMVVCYGMAIVNQARRMTRIASFFGFGSSFGSMPDDSDDSDDSNDGPFGDFTKGIASFTILGGLGTLFTIALVVSIIFNIIERFA